MTNSTGRSFARDEEGAIAPIYALALFGLIGIAGVGFDYARIMALDTELQNAADHAALAAATQLDGTTGARQRAQDSANNFFASTGSGFTNTTRLSNIDDDSDGNPLLVTQLTYKFYQDYTNDAPGSAATTDENAKVVEVTVGERSLQYALTPIVGAIFGTAKATAMATLQSAYCKVPPMMFCAPGGYSFDADDHIGGHLKMHTLPNASDPFSPGIFGFLDFPYAAPSGVSNPNTTLGWNQPDAGCTGETVESEPGVRDVEGTAFNTRFDVYPSGNNFTCSNGTFCPSTNTTKNYVKQQDFSNVTDPSDPTEVECADPASAGSTWVKADGIADITKQPGYGDDSCYGSSCSPDTGTSTLGDGSWDYAQYMSDFHSSETASTVFGDLGVDLDVDGSGAVEADELRNPTRYEVYQWENKNSNLPDKREVGRTTSAVKANGKYDVTLYCEYPKPVGGNGVSVSPTVPKDRRILTVAAVDCTGLNGSDAVNIVQWVDLFLLKPSDVTGGNKNFDAEIVGDAELEGKQFQGYSKRKPVLLR